MRITEINKEKSMYLHANINKKIKNKKSTIDAMVF